MITLSKETIHTITHCEDQCPVCGTSTSHAECDGQLNANSEMEYNYVCPCGAEFTEIFYLVYDETRYERTLTKEDHEYNEADLQRKEVKMNE